MTRILEGKPNGKGLRVGVVVSRFNSGITDKLLEGALEALEKCRVDAGAIEVLRVPGAFEIPVTAQKQARSGRVDGVICLGAIIKGGTPHWDYLSQAVTMGIGDAALATEVPMTNGVLTTETREQAVARAGKRSDNKGYDAAMALVEVLELLQRLDGDGARGPS